MRSSRRRSGFTLIEVLLTLAIMALAFAMIGGILLSVLTTSEKIDRKLRLEKAGHGILATIRRDLAGVYAYALGGPAFRGEDRTDLGQPADSLCFVTTARVLETQPGQPGARFVEVGYRVEDAEGEQEGLALFRRAEAWADDPLAGGEYVEIYSGLQSFNLQYLAQDLTWHDAWDAADKLPLAVKVTLELKVTDAERAAYEQAQVEVPRPLFEMIVGIVTAAAPVPDPAPESGNGPPPAPGQ